MEPTPENAAEVVAWLVEQGGCQGVFHAMSEDDLQRIIVHPATMIASDGEVPIFGRGAPHPRSYGTFARVLGVYVREKKILTLEDAVRKMSSFPGDARIGLTDRGVLRPGMKADIAVFDPARVRDAATFEKPHQYAEGFSHVIVNGQVVYENGAMTAGRGRAACFTGRGRRWRSSAEWILAPNRNRVLRYTSGAHLLRARMTNRNPWEVPKWSRSNSTILPARSKSACLSRRVSIRSKASASASSPTISGRRIA